MADKATTPALIALIELRIDSITLNPDSFVAAVRHVAQTEQRIATALPPHPSAEEPGP